MKSVVLSTLLFLFMINGLYCQNEDILEQDWFKESYYGSYEFYEAVNTLRNEGKLAGRAALIEVANQFQTEKKWQAYMSAKMYEVASYNATDEYRDGVKIGEEVIEYIKTNAPDNFAYTHAIYREIGRVYNSKLMYDEALKYHLEENQLLENNLKESNPYWYGSSHNDTGGTYANLGDFDKAVFHLEKAISIGEESKCDKCNELIANAYTNLGRTYIFLEKIEEAGELMRKGNKLLAEEHGEFDLRMVPQYYNLAEYYHTLDEKILEKDVLKKALFIIDNTATKDETYNKFILVRILFYYGFVTAKLKEHEESEKVFYRLIDVVANDQYYMPFKVDALTGLSKNKYELGDYDAAEQFLIQADSVNTHNQYVSGGQADNKIDQINLNFSNLYRLKGDYDKAILYLQKAANSYNVEKQDQLSWYSDLAELYLYKDQLDSAEIYTTKALKLSAKRFRPKSFFDLPEVSSMRDYREIYDALWVKSIIARRRANLAIDSMTKQQYFDLGLKTLELSNAFHKKNLKRMTFLRGAKSSTLFSDYKLNVRQNYNLLYDSYMFSKDPTILDRFIKNLQLIKGQQLWSNLIENEASVFGKIPYDILIQERDLLADIQKYEKELRRAKRKKDSARIREIESELLFNSQEAYSELKLKMEKDYPEYYEAKFDFKPESISSLQSILVDDEVLVEWVVESNEVYVFILEKNKQMQVLKTAFSQGQIDSMITFYEVLVESNVMRRNKRDAFITQSYSLYKVLLAPLMPYLEGKKRLILIPDQYLHYIPFEALISSDENKPLKDLDYLIRDYEVSYHYSTKLFARARKSEVNEQVSIYAFAPVYDEKKSPKLPEAFNNMRSLDIDGKFSPLPESEKEVNRILALFQKKKYRNAIALRENASESNLKPALQNNYQFIHIAGHSFANEENSNFSGIACYPVDDSTEDDILYSGEVSYLDIQADLITLSSCESGFGRLETTEGLLGLNRSFVYAGAPNVLFSLWKVYDKVSAELMVEFYENMLEGQSYAASLRNAKLKLLEKNTTANPHFWAPFLLIGR